MRDRFTKLVSTFFYVGYLPAAPGSFASFAGTLIYIIVYQNLVWQIVLIGLFSLLGFLTSGKMEKLLNKKDPSCIVIDEVAGVLIAFFLLPLTPAVIITTFFLFRAFDMFKVYPVNRFEKIEGAAGVMLDDLFAGLYTNITMHIAIRFAGIV